MTRRAGKAGLVVALVAALLAACAMSPPKPDPPKAERVPVVSVDQSRAIIKAITKTMTTADATQDVDLLSTRVTGPALDIRTADYKYAAAGGQLPTVTTDMTGEVVAQSSSWPRTVLVLTDAPPDLSSTPLVLVLRQESPREQYKLWGWAKLFSGRSMPKTAIPEVGSQVLSENTSDLVVPPADVLNQYADVLQNGDSSQYAKSFSSDGDDFRQSVEQVRSKIQQEMNGAPYEETHSAPNPPEVVLETANGGALVVGAMTTTSSAQALPGASLIDPSLDRVVKLAGGDPTTALTWTHTDIVVLYVPAASTKSPVVPVAALHTITGASLS